MSGSGPPEDPSAAPDEERPDAEAAGRDRPAEAAPSGREEGTGTDLGDRAPQAEESGPHESTTVGGNVDDDDTDGGGGAGLSDPLESMLADDFPAIAGLPEVESILPNLDADPASVSAVTGRLSPDIEALLHTSAGRVGDAANASSTAIDEANPIVLPQDMLDSVDELLAQDDSPTGGWTQLPTGTGATGVGAPRDEPTTSSKRLGEQTATKPHEALAPMGIDVPTDPDAGGRPDEGTSPGSVAASGADSQATQPLSRPEPASAGPAGAVAPVVPAPVGDGVPETTEQPPEASDRQGASPSVAPQTVAGPASEPPERVPKRDTRPPVTLPDDMLHLASPRIEEVSGPVLRMPTPEQVITGHPATQRDWPTPEQPQAPGLQAQTADAAPAPASPFAPGHMPIQPVGPTLPGRVGPHVPHTRPASSLPPPRTTLERQPPSSDELKRIAEQREPLRALAFAISHRATGSLALAATDSTAGDAANPVRRIVLRDGDIAIAASERPDEALIHFLVERGDLSPELAGTHLGRVPTAGRHAAAALIANGFLGQDDLWPVLRAHSEWILGRALLVGAASCELELTPPERLLAEPNVFGGAAGVEVFIEAVRRVVDPQRATAALGGSNAELMAGPHAALLAESALSSEETEHVRVAVGKAVGQLLAEAGDDFAPLALALVALDVLTTTAVARPTTSEPPPPSFDPLDANAIRERVRARLALVREGDYFALLGLSRSATGYEIRRAYVTLRRNFDPRKLLTGATADLADDVHLILEVLEEAYQILRDAQRRERYRRALGATQ